MTTREAIEYLRGRVRLQRFEKTSYNRLRWCQADLDAVEALLQAVDPRPLSALLEAPERPQEAAGAQPGPAPHQEPPPQPQPRSYRDRRLRAPRTGMGISVAVSERPTYREVQVGDDD